MTVKELIAELQKQNQELDVAVAVSIEGELEDTTDIEGLSGGEEVVFLDVSIGRPNGD